MIMKHIGTQTLETPRLLLRRHLAEDADSIFCNWASDPTASRFWSWEPHCDISETHAILADWLRCYDDPAYYHWAIIHRETGQPIGYIFLDSIDDTARSAAVHFLISPACRKHGYATEACQAVISNAFEVIGLRTMLSWHHQDNPASGRVLTKCGFSLSHSEYHAVKPERISGIYHHYCIEKR